MPILDNEKLKLMCTVIGCSEPHGRDCKLFSGCNTLERLIAKGYTVDNTKTRDKRSCALFGVADCFNCGYFADCK